MLANCLRVATSPACYSRVSVPGKSPLDIVRRLVDLNLLAAASGTVWAVEITHGPPTSLTGWEDINVNLGQPVSEEETLHVNAERAGPGRWRVDVD